MADEIITEEQVTDATTTSSVEDLQEEIAKLKAENAQIGKLKDAVSKASADAAEWKRQYRATLDEAERAKQEQADKYADMENELNGYKAEKRVNTYFAKLVSAGYTPEAAQRMADGLPEGVPDSFFEEQKSFIEAKTQEIKTQTINSQPGLSSGMPPSTSDAKSKEDADLRRWFGL